MSHFNDIQETKAQVASEDSRAVYLKPELADMGPVANLTKSGANNPGAEGSYS